MTGAPLSNRDRRSALLRAGLLTGVVDGLFSSLLNVFAYHSTAARLFQPIAVSSRARSTSDR